MLGILVILIISWILLFLFYRDHILALGFLPLGKRFKQLVIGFLISAILCSFVLLLESYFKSSHWKVNQEITSIQIVNAFWWDFKSVLTEELIFRGALLYILIKKTGNKLGVFASAIAFGIYHWFSHGVFGNLLPMIFVFLSTGLMGYVWALAFSKTKSIMLALGFHLGWNFMHNTIFSKGPLGELLFISEGGNALTGSMWIINFVIGLILPAAIQILYIKYLSKN